MFKTLFELFLSFMKIGFTSFGGLSMVPLINQEMLSHNWMTQEEVVDIIAIAEMTPGPLGINCATFSGMRTCGILGAISASLGVLMPTFTICILVSIFFTKFKDGKRTNQIMIGVRPVTMGMIFSVVISLMLSNYIVSTGSISYTSICLSLFDLLLFFKWDISVPLVILINAGLGAILFGVLGLV